MAKTFKKFREDYWDDDEWGDNEDRQVKNKNKRLQSRRDRRKQKVNEKFASIEDGDEPEF